MEQVKRARATSDHEDEVGGSKGDEEANIFYLVS